jgi:hypothetical protein
MTCFEAEKNLKFPRISPAPTVREGIRRSEPGSHCKRGDSPFGRDMHPR